VRSLVIGGNQPYAWPDSPLTRIVTEGLAVSREERSMEPMVRAFEDFWEVGFPEPQRERWLDNDPLALEAAWRAALDEEAIADDLGRWQIPCLIFLGAADADFLEGARRAAEEIPDAELLMLEEADHYAAHMSQDEVVLDAVLRTLRQRN
jgi:pimeloyl-ACP methyl ester carboxylesterase